MLFISFFLATVSLAIGAFAYALSRTSGARNSALPSHLFIAAGGYGLVDGLGYVPGISAATRSYLASSTIAISGIFLISATRHIARARGFDRHWAYRLMFGALVAASLTSLFPGLLYTADITPRLIALSGSTYYDTTPTPFGYVVFGVLVGSLVAIMARMLVEWRRGVPRAAYFLTAFGVLAAAAASDVLVVSDLSPAPYLLNEGIFVAALVFAAAIVRDIAEDRSALNSLRVDLEERVAERTRELAHRTDELSRSERMAVVGRLAAGIAHELNNPAAAIKASLDDARLEIMRHGGMAELGACIDISLAAVDRVTRIVRQFGAMAGGAESSDHPLPSTHLAKAVNAAVSAARDSSRPDVDVITSIDRGLWVFGMSTAIVEAIAALVTNAVEAVPDGRPGAVSVLAFVKEDTVSLVVRDNGVGMPDQIVERAFEPFFTTKEIGHSSGLGLPVARGLVESMGGALELRSIVGVGTEACIRLRLSGEPESSGARRLPDIARVARVTGAIRVIDLLAPEQLAETAGTGPADATTGSPAPGPKPKPRVLLVDDDELVRMAMARYLGKAFDVDTAGSVDEGLAKAGRHYDSIISDVVMPNGGGQRFYLELMGRDPSLAERVIFITGGAFRSDIQDFLATQGQPVLNKPVRLSDLKAAVDRLPSRPA